MEVSYKEAVDARPERARAVRSGVDSRNFLVGEHKFSVRHEKVAVGEHVHSYNDFKLSRVAGKLHGQRIFRAK